MLIINKTTNVTGYSVIKTGDVQENAVAMNGNVNYDAATYNVNTSILNRALYKANKETVDADIDGFYDYMDKLLDDDSATE